MMMLFASYIKSYKVSSTLFFNFSVHQSTEPSSLFDSSALSLSDILNSYEVWLFFLSRPIVSIGVAL